MIDKKRDIYIKFVKVQEIVDLLEEIREQQVYMESLFRKYDQHNTEEQRMFENWATYLEEIVQRLDHVTL